jgi:hypothetical protein
VDQHHYIDISDKPELARLADEVAKTGKPCILRRGDREVAVLMPPRPVTRSGKARRMKRLAGVEPVPRLTIDELIARRLAWVGPAFSDEEIKVALEQDRAERWRAKSQ